MSRVIHDLLLPVSLLLLLTLLIGIFDLDQIVSGYYFSDGWPTGEKEPWNILYRYGYYPAYMLGFGSLFFLAYSYFNRALIRWRKQAAFFVLLLILGPGLLVNAVFKDNWGRPRPRETVQFGGKLQFHHPWERGTPGVGKSFPTGHGSSAFYLAMPYFALRRDRPVLARSIFYCGMTYGLLMGFARITQGGHFLSDILWSWGVVHLCALTLCHLLRLDLESTPPCSPHP